MRYTNCMHTVLVTFHIVTMVASMAFMSGALLLGVAGKTVATRVATAGMSATLLGFASGLLLTLDAPLTIKCAGLTAYALGVSILYYAGFGLGNSEKARLVRSS